LQCGGFGRRGQVARAFFFLNLFFPNYDMVTREERRKKCFLLQSIKRNKNLCCAELARPVMELIPFCNRGFQDANCGACLRSPWPGKKRRSRPREVHHPPLVI
jgi:hypothetical protein